MLVVPFLATVGSAASRGGAHAALGDISDVARLLTTESMQALERAHSGYFAFLAFHPTADAAVADYLGAGSLPSDSGSRALVLFTTVETPTAVWNYSAAPLSMITIEDHADLPVLVALRHLFGEEVPALPGIALFSSFSEDSDVIYFSLADAPDAAGVRAFVRATLELANKAWNGKRDTFADRLAVRAQRKKIPFLRTGRRSMLQWLVQVYQWMAEHRGDIVAVAGIALP
jgi:hypothetical protein